MKTLLGTSAIAGLIAILAASVAYADCRLRTPIPIGGNEFWKNDADESQRPLIIENAVFDQTIKSQAFDQRYSSASKVVELFSLMYLEDSGKHRLYNWPGARVRPDVCGLPYGCASGAGFSWFYGGVPPKAEGVVNDSGTQRTFQTTIRDQFNGSTGIAVTQLTVTIEHDAITSLQMVLPVFEDRTQDGIHYLRFTNENQTVCLLSGNVR